MHYSVGLTTYLCVNGLIATHCHISQPAEFLQLPRVQKSARYSLPFPLAAGSTARSEKRLCGQPTTIKDHMARVPKRYFIALFHQFPIISVILEN
jgi:hypothetical protein